jgi:broad specificity phosphatase PhoE
MSVLLLVRHGQASWGEADYDRLSSVGEEQARVLGAALAARGVRPDLVVRGSMLRHRQTADGAVGAAGWDAQIAEDADWDEFDHMSTLSGAVEWSEIEGETYDERVRRFEATIDRWSSGEHDDEYRESFPAFQQRVRGAFERTVERLEPKQTAVVFTSGGPVSWVAATLAEGGLPAWSRLSKVVVNSSVTKVLTGRRGTNLLTFNDHSHLEGGAPGLLTYR